MDYTTIYDISTVPYDGWIWFILMGVFLLLMLYSFGVFTADKPGLYPQRYWVVGFGVVIAIIAGISYWDFNRLRNRLIANDCTQLDGVIEGHWEKKWADRDSNNKTRWRHYEGFTVKGVKFGYFVGDAEHAGFQNADSVQVPLYDGLPVRLRYITDKHIDDGSLENRILKFEIAARP